MGSVLGGLMTEVLEVRCGLKVCERCGVLWVREVGREEKSCPRCREKFEEEKGRGARG